MPAESVRRALVSDWFDAYARIGYAAEGASIRLIGFLMERVLWFALSRRFPIGLGRDDIARFERVCLLCADGIGHAGRSLGYTALGIFAVRAALDFDPDEARGVADTIRELAGQP